MTSQSIRILLIEGPGNPSGVSDCKDLINTLEKAGHIVLATRDAGMLKFLEEFIHVDLVIVESSHGEAALTELLKVEELRNIRASVVLVRCGEQMPELRHLIPEPEGGKRGAGKTLNSSIA